MGVQALINDLQRLLDQWCKWVRFLSSKLVDLRGYFLAVHWEEMGVKVKDGIASESNSVSSGGPPITWDPIKDKIG